MPKFQNKVILITGCAGFIGFHLCKKLLSQKIDIVGIDNLNKYYDSKLKKKRLFLLKKFKNFSFYKEDIRNKNKLLKIFKKYYFSNVVHLAAQAGVRYSVQKPDLYFSNNLKGFFNILDASRLFKIKHLVFASSSSVYGDSSKFPINENFNTDNPLSFYAATKKSNEVMAHSYANIYKLPLTCLRFFTVYGPYGRPDMSLFKFCYAIKNKKKIDLFNKGKHVRDFTHVDDAVLSIIKILKKIPNGTIPFEKYNIGSDKPIKLVNFLRIIENNLNLKAKANLLNIQKGDVLKTHASIKSLFKKIKYKPRMNIKTGIKQYINWFNSYYVYKKKI